ncbi:hypothetical protein BDA96_03G442100 [Sorghum bicolor]|uniref:Uncharacterized protein n=1 Tax=Sorghum bicolor TaxID=4558 RepID=A0A921RJ17_SORBI|nr:hypothetical protein BDA96_03G442100 [Sorghum bicolor]
MAVGGRKQQAAGAAGWTDGQAQAGCLAKRSMQARCLPAAATATPCVSVHRDRMVPRSSLANRSKTPCSCWENGNMLVSPARNCSTAGDGSTSLMGWPVVTAHWSGHQLGGEPRLGLARPVSCVQCRQRVPSDITLARLPLPSCGSVDTRQMRGKETRRELWHSANSSVRQ